MGLGETFSSRWSAGMSTPCSGAQRQMRPGVWPGISITSKRSARPSTTAPAAMGWTPGMRWASRVTPSPEAASDASTSMGTPSFRKWAP